ncbi:hypothetical protein ACBY01_07225 [Sphingomonas sp. ac-8]|uniref:hypothetical protein n=1 Tax=Sphingomonas sp. ac-8 TaxID=3242977 RepID=UPI003A805308
MQRGRKADTPGAKEARGTLRPFRDAGKTEIIVPGLPPVQPDYLTAEAIDVWHEVLPRAMATGVTEIDSAMFARYCSLEALVRKAFNAGDVPPPAAYLTVLRQHEELLRIAGPKSRVAGGSKNANDGTNGNPFARNGHRAR